MTDQYRVFGNPIKHSQSPQIHGQFTSQFGEELEYARQWVALDGFEQAVRAFFADGGKGLNITVPFKQQAYSMAKQPSVAAQLARAANTLWCNTAGEICADNTDGVGLVRNIIHNWQGQLQGQRILIIGAGGAVRGVLAPLLAQLPAQLVMTNRTYGKAVALAQDFAHLGNIKAVAMDNLEGVFDWIINGTSASLSGDLPPLPYGLFSSNSCSYDMMYGKKLTVFSQWALAQGAQQAFDGLGMLVEQAAESFAIWRGVRPETAHVLRWLRTQL